jgi:hypothetical protein
MFRVSQYGIVLQVADTRMMNGSGIGFATLDSITCCAQFTLPASFDGLHCIRLATSVQVTDLRQLSRDLPKRAAVTCLEIA